MKEEEEEEEDKEGEGEDEGEGEEEGEEDARKEARRSGCSVPFTVPFTPRVRLFLEPSAPSRCARQLSCRRAKANLSPKDERNPGIELTRACSAMAPLANCSGLSHCSPQYTSQCGLCVSHRPSARNAAETDPR
jgi:hypothetical protein